MELSINTDPIGYCVISKGPNKIIIVRDSLIDTLVYNKTFKWLLPVVNFKNDSTQWR